ncbi:MAG TPA: NAD-dependent epimerase/dehydratase family protein [Patescibacteria group bacterium]|nr:NAD-dependent epimerase/dehydratase family protein [Patescibacteria group bacterium]
MRILVTGGSGFLGKHLCRALVATGHSVINIDKRTFDEVETVVGDVMDQSLIERHMPGIEAVFHLASYIEAGESVEHPKKYLENNVLGTLSVLEAMRIHNVKKFLFSSSAAIYGEPLRTPIKEDDRTIPINPYGTTKLAMEGLVSSYAYSYGFTGVALRYFNLYGPGEDHQPETHAIPRFIHQIESGDDVTVWGDGNNRRDYVYIDDVVRAHLLALDLPQGYHYMNLSGKNATSVLDIVQTLEHIMRKKANLKHFSARPGDPVELFADASKAKEVLGWEPQMSLEEGLSKTVEWFRAQST